MGPSGGGLGGTNPVVGDGYISCIVTPVYV